MSLWVSASYLSLPTRPYARTRLNRAIATQRFYEWSPPGLNTPTDGRVGEKRTSPLTL